MMEESMPVIFGMGNPLLDIQLQTGDEFLQKYKMAPGGYSFFKTEQEGLYEEMASSRNVSYIPGGSTLNSIRVCQALARRPGVTFYTGCVGNDKYAETLERLCIDEGVNVKFAISDQNHTGICGVAIVDKERSLCTSLGAALDLKHEHIKTCWKYVEGASVYYSAGFVLEVCFTGMLEVAQFCSQNNRIYATNISAPFIAQTFKKEMMQLMPYVDILFGNEHEFRSFAVEVEWGDASTLEEIAVRIAALPKSNQARPRAVVISQGALPTIVSCGWVKGGAAVKHAVPAVKEEDIVDTNGAGDAFVGGFLYGILRQMDCGEIEGGGGDRKGNSRGCCVLPVELDIKFCTTAAHMAARHILMHNGCSFNFTSEETEALNSILIMDNEAA